MVSTGVGTGAELLNRLTLSWERCARKLANVVTQVTGTNTVTVPVTNVKLFVLRLRGFVGETMFSRIVSKVSGIIVIYNECRCYMTTTRMWARRWKLA